MSRARDVTPSLLCAIVLAACVAASPAHTASPSASKEERRSKGFLRGDVPAKFVADERIDVSLLKIETVMYWEVWSLLGSAVRFCVIAYRVPQKSPVVVKHRDGSLSTVPASVAKQVTLYDAELTGRVSTRNAPYETRMTCDGGAILAAADVSDAEWARVQQWTPEQRRARFSFNTPESPEWRDLFHVGFERRPVPDATAMSLVKDGFGLEAPSTPAYGVTKAKVNLGPIHAWLAEQRRAKLKERAETLEKAEQQRVAAGKKRDAALRGKQFWDSPANPELELAKRDRDQVVADLRADEAKADKAIADARRLSKDAAAWVERKRLEAEARPPPGGELARAEHTLLSVLNARFRRSHRGRTLPSCIYERTDEIDQTLEREGLCRYSFRMRMDVEEVRSEGICTFDVKNSFYGSSAPIDFGAMNVRWDDGDLVFNEPTVEQEGTHTQQPLSRTLSWFAETDDGRQAAAAAIQKLIELCPAAARSSR